MVQWILSIQYLEAILTDCEEALVYYFYISKAETELVLLLL